MGSFISQKKEEASPSRGLAVSEKETLKETDGSPTNSKNDGRSYKEVLRAGPETGKMSELRKSRNAWEFCKAPTNKKVSVQKCLQDPSRDRQGTS